MSAQLIESSPVEPLVVGVHLYPGDTWFREVHVRSVTTQAPVDLSGWVFEARLGEHVGVVDASRAAEGRLAVTFSPEQTTDTEWGDSVTLSGTLAGGRRTFLHGSVGAAVGSSIPVGLAQKTRVVSSDVDISVYAAPRGDKGQDGSAVSVALVQRAEAAEGRAVSAADAAEGFASSARMDASLATDAAAAADGYVDETAANARVSLEATAGIVAARDAAAASAGKANTDADRAGTSAFNAAGSAAAAQGSENAAGTARTGAETARVGAESAKTGADLAKTAAEAARDLALAGQFAGAALYSGNNLDDVKTPGVYFSASQYGTAQGYPGTGVWVLEVFRPSTTVGAKLLQRATSQAAGSSAVKGSYIRRFDSGAWTAWAFMPVQRINSPAGQPGVEVLTFDDANFREQALMPANVPLGSVDLNTVLLTGSYTQAVNTLATGALNYPVSNRLGVLEVSRDGSAGGGVIQRYRHKEGNTFYSSRVVYERQYDGTAWSAWRAYTSQRVDETAGRAIYTWDDRNGREQLVYGDTGWRDITSSLLNGATAQLVLIRRFGSYVSLRVVALQLPSTSATDPIYVPPAGFVPEETYGLFRERINTGSAFGFLLASNVRLWGQVTAGANNTTNRFDGTLTAPTSQAWPTSLPGVAYGGVPA